MKRLAFVVPHAFLGLWLSLDALGCHASGGQTISAPASEATDSADTPTLPPGSAADTIIRSFHQGEAGNCTSIGFIKAVLNRYSLAKAAFLEFTQDGSGNLHVKTHDGRTYDLTSSELKSAASKAKLVLGSGSNVDSSLIGEANQLFAVLGKACAVHCGPTDYCEPSGTAQCGTYDQALDYLDSGLKWNTPPNLLGFVAGKDWTPLTGIFFVRWLKKFAFINRYDSCVAATGGHTFFVSHGRADKWGTDVPFRSLFSGSFALKSTHTYCFTDDPDADSLVSEQRY